MQQRHQRFQMFHLISQGWLKRKRTGSIVLFRLNIRVPIGVPFIQWWSNAWDILKPLCTSHCVIPSLVYLAQQKITPYKPQPLHSHTCIYIYVSVCIPWFPFIFQSFKRFWGIFFAFHRFSSALNDFVLFLPFLDVFPATCIHVITSGMDGSVLFAVVLIVHPLC